MSVTTAIKKSQLVELAQDAPDRTVVAMSRVLAVAAEHRGLDTFFAHVLNVLADTGALGETTLVGEQLTPRRAVSELLDHPDMVPALRVIDPLAAARVRGVGVKRKLLEMEGGAVSAETLGGLLGITRQAVDKRRKRGALIGLDLGRRGYAYPVWQVDLHGLPEVLAELPELSAWAQAAFMLAPNPWIEGHSPLETLRVGDTDAVVRAARLYGEHLAA